MYKKYCIFNMLSLPRSGNIFLNRKTIKIFLQIYDPNLYANYEGIKDFSRKRFSRGTLSNSPGIILLSEPVF
jgi:hypothetical protein